MKNLFNRANGLKINDERIGPLLGGALGSLRESGECPTPEDIAALSENKIGGKERERLFLHIAGCDRCREAYSMVCEIATGEVSASNTDFRWQARRLVPLAAAAGLILVIVSWPMFENRKCLVNETVSPYIQKPAANEPEKAVTATLKAGDTSQDVHEDIKGAMPTLAARTPAKEKMEDAPVSAAPSVMLQEMQAARPTVSKSEQLQANVYKSADGASKTKGSLGMTASPVTEAPMPAEKSKAGFATPADEDGFLAISRPAPAPKKCPEPEFRFSAAPTTKSAESPAEAVNLHRRVEIDKEQRLRLSKADATTLDKVKIEEIFKDLKLDTCGFPLQDINKVVVQWARTPRRGGKVGVMEPAGQDKTHADISLEEGGVLMIDVQGTPLHRKNRGGKVAVGC